MQTTLIIKSDDNAKLQLLLSLAKELQFDVKSDASGFAEKVIKANEPIEPYNSSFKSLRNAFLAQTSSQQKMDLFIKVANEMGIDLFPINNEQLEDVLLAQRSLSDEWNAPENNHWDEFLRTHKID